MTISVTRSAGIKGNFEVCCGNDEEAEPETSDCSEIVEEAGMGPTVRVTVTICGLVLVAAELASELASIGAERLPLPIAKLELLVAEKL